MKNICSAYLFSAIALIQTLTSHATHNRSGEILYYKLPGAFTYSIVVIKYMNDGQGVADRCVDTVHFGDGTKGIANRLAGSLTGCGCGSPNGCGDLIVNESNYKVKKSVYSIVHTYPGPGTYTVWSQDPNRSPSVYNIPNSMNVQFYIESLIIIDLADSDNSSPQLPRAPIDRGLVGDCFYHNPCAYDPDGDSLSYAITTCKGDNGQTVLGYSFPTTGSGGTFGLDPVTGLLNWCTPQIQALYSFAVKISEWRRPNCDSAYKLRGYVIRDFEVMVNAGVGITITTTPFTNTCITVGTQFVKSFSATVGGSSNIFSVEVLGSTTSPFSGAPPAAISPSLFTTGNTATLNWNTTCAHAQKMPHFIHLVMTTNAAPAPKTFYKTIKVYVTPPQPKILSAVTTTNQITLTWNSLKSCNNLQAYNVYRNFGTSSWAPSPCVQGVPSSSGYSLIATIHSGTPIDTVYSDTDLWWLPVTATGHYIVTALMNDCSESNVDTIISKKLLVGLADKTNSDLKITVFPNPSKSQFIVSILSQRKEPLQISLYSVDGKKVLEQSTDSDTQIIINSTSLPEGVYLLTLSVGDKSYQRKLIKN